MLDSAVDALKAFHNVFDIPDTATPRLAPVARMQLRMALHAEEFDELTQGMARGDLVEIADGIADLIYVLLGTALEYGIPIARVFREVHRSNMTKVWPDGTVHRREDGKILKPEGYSKPDIWRILEEARG